MNRQVFISDFPLDSIKSGLSLSAQSPALCELRNNNIAKKNFLNEKIYSNKWLTETEKAVIELQYLYGLRISELLAVKPTDVMATGQIQITVAKTNNTRFVIPVHYFDFWLNRLRYELPLSTIYSRFYFYRLYKKLGFYHRYAGNVNNSVTHYFRHMLVLDLQSSGMTHERISQFLAHNSKKTLDYYLKSYGKKN